METDLKTIGLSCAFIRTIILSPFFLLLMVMLRGSLANYSFFDIILVAVVLFIFSIVIACNWICALRYGPFQEIQSFCNQTNDPQAMMMNLEKVWNDDFLQAENYRIDNEYLIWARKMHAFVIPLKDIYGIKYIEGVAWGSDHLWVYLKNNTLKQLSFRGRQGLKIVEHIEKNMPEIIIGETADSQLQKTLVGKINIRYQIVKIQERIFIVDYANPRKLSSYLSFGEKYRFSERGAKRFWHAWEISKEELQNIKYKSYEESKSSSKVVENLSFAGGLIAVVLIARSPFLDAVPIYDLVRGQLWIIPSAITSVTFIYFFYINIISRIETEKYVEFRISRNESTYTKSQLFQYIVVRISILVILLFFIVVLLIGNGGLIPYVLFLFLLFSYIFVGLWVGAPIIDPQSAIERNEKIK